jgi:hypothetical protein
MLLKTERRQRVTMFDICILLAKARLRATPDAADTQRQIDDVAHLCLL